MGPLLTDSVPRATDWPPRGLSHLAGKLETMPVPWVQSKDTCTGYLAHIVH